jgi:hypothetical protein
MRHEAALKMLDELDAGQEYGRALRLHLSRCPSCEAAARLMEEALRAYRGAGSLIDERGDPSHIEDRVMAAIRLMPSPQQDFALRDWLLPAAIIALSIFLLPLFGKDLGFMEPLLGSGYVLSLSLVLGIAFTAYSALFIATHLSELQSYLEKRGLMPR